MDLQLDGKIALISGASAGIGRVTAKTLGREGVRVVVVARRRPSSCDWQRRWSRKGRQEPMVLVDDLGDDGAFDRVSAAVLEEHGRLDILVNNLGQARPFDLDTTEAEWDEAFRLNFATPRLLSRPVHPRHGRAKFGRIIT